MMTVQPAIAPQAPPRPPVIAEAEYWEKYYDGKSGYEWKNGRLEEIPVSDWQTWGVFEWFMAVLRQYLDAYPIAHTIGLEMGFRLRLPEGIAIRKPDLAVVLNANPVSWQPLDRRYDGIFDLCVEALSDSKPWEITRDTVVKKAEYASAGVPEYFILHHDPRHQAFYRLKTRGIYEPVPAADGIIRSGVLPGFQFRRADLLQRPGLEKMLEDPVYRGFMLLAWQRDRARAEQEAEARRQAEQRAEAAEAEIARLRALLGGSPRGEAG